MQETAGLPTLPVKKFNWSDDVEDTFGKSQTRLHLLLHITSKFYCDNFIDNSMMKFGLGVVRLWLEAILHLGHTYGALVVIFLPREGLSQGHLNALEGQSHN